MKFKRHQFTEDRYACWSAGLLIPDPHHYSIYTVRCVRGTSDFISKITVKAIGVHDALERACFAATHASSWRPEDVELHAVFDQEENLLWINEENYNIVQKKYEFRGMDRRSFLTYFGLTSAGVLYGFPLNKAHAGTTSVSLSGTASNFTTTPGDQVYSTSGSYSFLVPVGVYMINVVCVGAGGGVPATASQQGAGGGGLAWVNGITVSPGQGYSVDVGAGGSGNGGNSRFYVTFSSVISAEGGKPGGAAVGATALGQGGGGAGGAYFVGTIGASRGGANGGSGALHGDASYEAGGGGAAGYTGNGGDGGWGGIVASGTGSGGSNNWNSIGTNGIGGGGGGAGGGSGTCGGGVGLFGQTTNGTAGAVGGNGGGGSGGAAGTTGGGGAYGGGGGARGTSGATNGGSGAVRIMWGTGKSFPNNAS